MSEQFGSLYAGAYDATYADKDYEAECDLVEEAFRRFGSAPVSAILDLGCGTGNHSIPLARSGYEVAGVDLSTQMLSIAAQKAAQAGVAVAFSEGDVRTVDLGRTFDAALLMFAVIGYQRTNADVLATLRSVRRHLEPGGVLFFDIWYGPGVLTSPPGSGEREIQTPDGTIRRSVEGELDVPRHLCTVRYRLARDAEESFETHVMRYFFPLELELFLDVCGFELVALAPVGALDGEPGPETWNANVVARAV
jgi:SAM-dependent methyltransferase